MPGHLLLVDDEVEILEILNEYLTTEGFQAVLKNGHRERNKNAWAN